MWLRSQLFLKLCGLYLLPTALVLAAILTALNAQLENSRRTIVKDNLESRLISFQSELAATDSPEQILNKWSSAKRSIDKLCYVLIRNQSSGLPTFTVMSTDYKSATSTSSSDNANTNIIPLVPELPKPLQRSLWRESGERPIALSWDSSTRDVLYAASRQTAEPKETFIVLRHDAANRLSRDQLNQQSIVYVAILAWLCCAILLAVFGLAVIRPLGFLLQAVRNPAESLERRDALLRLRDRNDELGDLSRALEMIDKVSQEKQSSLSHQAQLMTESSNQLSAILQAMVEGVIAINKDRLILFANDVACQLMDLKIEAAMGRPLFECVRSTIIQDTVTEVLERGEMIKVEFKHPRRDTYLNLVVSPLAKGGVILVLHDVTAIRRLEVLRKDFMNGVSHELKTPLTVIQACTDTLLNGAVSDPDAARRFLQKIGTQSERLHQLIVGMLQLSRVESGQQIFNEEAVDLAAISKELMDQLQPIADTTEIQLTYDGPEEAYVLADQQAIRTIVNNLIDNALKYTNSNGAVQVIVKEEQDANVISVRDNGVGISQEDQARIFERFYRVEKDRNRERGGTGLGLAIVKHLCHALDAEVRVHSEHRKGCEFTVRFPFRDENLEDN
ncbi:MAG: ATP-binding protein [Fuerstiella sp.]